MEKNYDFRERLRQVHKKDRKNDAVWQKITGAVVNDSWQIVFPDDASKVVRNAAWDLQEYFEVSMDCYVKAVPLSRKNAGKAITLQLGLEAAPSSYRLVSDGAMPPISWLQWAMDPCEIPSRCWTEPRVQPSMSRLKASPMPSALPPNARSSASSRRLCARMPPVRSPLSPTVI